MKRWIRVVALFYPRGWREEFGDEFDAVLEDVRPGWRVLANVLKGAVSMWISEGGNWLKIAVAMAAVGALVALGLSFRVSPNYGSTGTVMFMPQPDPVRPASPEVLRARTTERVNEMKEQILSRSDLASVINDPRLQLYKAEVRTKPLDEVLEQMRRDIQIQVKGAQSADGPILISISFFYPDQNKATAAVQKLTNKFIEENQNTAKADADAYRGFWDDMHNYDHGAPAPPPPVGDVARALLVANLPARAPNRGIFVVWGLLLGVLAAIAIRWPRNVLRLAGFATGGFVLAAAVSYLIPNRFTSTATMEISPAQLTEDPLASPPPVTPAIEFLRQIEPRLFAPQLFGAENLAAIIQDPRLNLYPEEQKRKSIQEIATEMRANLRITPVDSVPGSASVFHISFTYPDRFKAQQTVEAVMTKIWGIRQRETRADASRSFKAHTIWERKAGEVLDVLDVANLPSVPDGPPRAAIALCGACVGLLLGLFRLGRRQSDPQVPSAFREATAGAVSSE